MTYYSDTVMTPLQSALLFCDRIGMDMEYVYTDSRIIDDMLQRINQATALADGWDWALGYPRCYDWEVFFHYAPIVW